MTFRKFFLEQVHNSIVILPGGFKPPHKGHFEALKFLLKNSDAKKAIVLVGAAERDGINQDQSIKIWNIYKKYIPAEVEIVPVVGVDKAGRPATPLSMTYDFIEDNQNSYNKFYVGAGTEDLARFKGLEKDKNKYKGAFIVSIPPQFSRISGTETRKLLSKKDKTALNFIPAEVKEREQIAKILGF